MSQFDGDGFDSSPIEGKEASRHRHMFHVLSQNWVVLDEKTVGAVKDAATVIFAIRIISNIIKVGGPVAIAFMVLGAWAKTQGWI